MMMSEAERRAGAYGVARLLAGDRSGALAVFRPLFRKPHRRPKPDPEDQRVLALPPTDPLQLTFRCERLNVSMVVEECIQRRADVWPSGRRKGHAKRPECSGCHQGIANAAACPGVILRSPSQPPEVLPASQRLAKRARALVGLAWEDPVALDPMTEASMLTPDDGEDWRA